MGSDGAVNNGAGDPDLGIKSPPPEQVCRGSGCPAPGFGGPRAESERSLSGPPAPADEDVPALDF